eukprot:TRINITY_DN6606_c0_g1_i2.p1 TRINITY_DN6606_c0_g1~~TRINITY_DN6606_c0_g1_i2.p1  ORF type:complete len:450 (-),score=101.46 TRINITY_DN6606_c0_g1_i2:370-1719(-)
MVLPWYDSSLHDFVRQDKARTPSDMIGWTLQAVEGLSYLHSKRIAHRDLKGSNILVKLTEDGQKVASLHLSDFGLSFPASDVSNVEADTILGTGGYMAPEMDVAKGSYDPFPVDVFALGRTIFEMIKGKQPNYRDFTLATSPDDGDDLKFLIGLSHWCCQDDPKKRPTSSHLAQEIQDYLQNKMSVFFNEDVVKSLQSLDWKKLYMVRDHFQMQGKGMNLEEEISMMDKIMQDHDVQVVADAVLEKMNSASSVEHWSCIVYVASMISQSKEFAAALAKKGGVRKAIEIMLLHPSDADIQWKAASMFHRCCRWDKTVIGKNMAVPIIKAIREHASHIEVERHCWLAAMRISKNSDDSASVFISEDVLSCAMHTFRQSEHQPMWTNAAIVLCEIIKREGLKWIEDKQVSELREIALTNYLSSQNASAMHAFASLNEALPWPAQWKLNLKSS